MELKVRTLTPLWTGDVDGRCNRIKETGIIGSLRWWYEAVVRGLGGYACDPTSDSRCELSGKEKTHEERLDKLCPACFLFGCGGWKRRFRLDINPSIQNSNVPIHFRTTLKPNQKWLGRIFHGNETSGGEYDLDSVNVYYWDEFKDVFSFLVTDNHRDHILNQLGGLISFISEYGFAGAKPQHGFGQIEVFNRIRWTEVFKELHNKIEDGVFYNGGKKQSSLPNLNQAVFLTYSIPFQDLKTKGFFKGEYHYGSYNKKERRYIPCSFDLRYKGKGNLGFRTWLEKDTFGQRPSREQRKKLDPLLGAVDRKGYPLKEDERQSSRVIFGMPVKTNNDETYHLRIIAFFPPGLSVPLSDGSALNDVTELHTKISSYIKDIFPTSELLFTKFGGDIVKEIKGGPHDF